MRVYLITLLIILASYFKVTSQLQLIFFNTFSPVILYLKESSHYFKDINILVSNINYFREENYRLKELVYRIQDENYVQLVSSLNEGELNTLKNSFKSFSILQDRKIIICKIIYYDSFKSLLILENPEKNEIPENSLVLIGGNLVGFVEESNSLSIKVKLVSNSDLAINTNIINSQKFKIKTVLDSESGDSLVINNILTTEEVSVGDLVVTSNTNEGVFPDLIIGNIQRIEGISSQTFRKAYIKRNYDLNMSSYVGVLINE